MESTRARRVGELIKEELSELIRREVKDPRVGFVTITGVDVTPDLRYATIYISVLGSNKEREDSLKILQKTGGFLRKELAKRIRLKYFPELKFEFDRSIESALRIEKIIKKLQQEEEAHE